MTIIEVEMRVRERRQLMLEISENNRLLSLAARPVAPRLRIALVLLALVERLDPQLRRDSTPVPCSKCYSGFHLR